MCISDIMIIRKEAHGMLLRKLAVVLVILLIAIFGTYAAADSREAQDITRQCKYKTSETPYSSGSELRDRNYLTFWKSKQEAEPWIRVTTPDDSPCYGVYLCFASQTPVPWKVQVPDGDAWVTVASGTGEYLHEYAALPGATVFRITTDTPDKERLVIGELYVLGEGAVPDWVQFWEPTPEKADLLLITAHPDDEFVFFGGLLPDYAVERGLHVVVACLTYYDSQRTSELLNGLWSAGIHTYPSIGLLRDRYSRSAKDAYEICGGKDAVWEYVTELYRQYKPEVVLSHDVQGEYGHGMHMACADAAQRCLAFAVDAARYPASAEAYGVWQVKKLYLHLYPENTVEMDWDRPLAAYGGLTGLDIANEALTWHISQQSTSFAGVMPKEHKHSAYAFGLVFSTVGEDVLKNDFMENIE